MKKSLKQSSSDLLIDRRSTQFNKMSEFSFIQRAHDYPFSQYNLFVDCYNCECNRSDDIYFVKMEESNMYRFTYQMLAKPLSTSILIFTLTLLPILNLFFYYIIWQSLFIYNKRKKIFLRNLSFLSNPFERMIFSPEVCEIMGRNHWFFNIQEKDLPSLSFDQQTIKILKNRIINGQIQFMVYDESFIDFYRRFPKCFRMHVIWVIISTILILIFGFITFVIIKFGFQQNDQQL